jgi:hypothetical protein
LEVTFVTARRYAAFWSYARFDDKHDGLWLTELRKALVAEVQALFDKQIEIFSDIDGISWGEEWKQKLISSSDAAMFLIPIITPSYFGSEPCRQELKQFIDRESTTGFKEFILPLYYIDTPQLHDELQRAADLHAQTVAEHNYIDIRELRHRSITSYEAKQKIKELATALVQRLNEYARRQINSIAMRGYFTAPHTGAKVSRKPLLSGTLENISAGTDVWLVVETGTAFHPQVQLSTESGAFQATLVIGAVNEVPGHEFPVHVLAVTEDVSKAFTRYRLDSVSFKKWVGVPKTKPIDSKVLATVKVIRDDSAST